MEDRLCHSLNHRAVLQLFRAAHGLEVSPVARAEIRKVAAEDLVRILKEPKNSLVRQYQTMFELEDVELKLLYAGEGTLWTDMSRSGGDFGVRATIPLQNGSTEK